MMLADPVIILQKMNIAILGKGVFGKAIGSLLKENRIAFKFVALDIPMRERADLVFIVVPTQQIRNALLTNKKFFHPETIFVNCSKGIEQNSHLLPFQIVNQVLSPKYYYTLVGPSFASEILEKHPTLVSLGFSDQTYIQTIKDLLQTDNFRIVDSPGFEALELSAALKNVYAIICGFSAGLNFKMNTNAKLITLALMEIEKVLKALSFEYESITLPGLVGDLILTCTSSTSRNYRFGYNLASMQTKKALESIGSTVEGYYTSKSIMSLVKAHNLDLPLASLTAQIIEEGQKALPVFKKFIATR